MVGMVDAVDAKGVVGVVGTTVPRVCTGMMVPRVCTAARMNMGMTGTGMTGMLAMLVCPYPSSPCSWKGSDADL